jgi:DNA repair exonuclease SbcCD ATPase subunit
VITLKKLQWSNCFSYGADNELDLTESVVTQLVGTNGTGKSSIPLILEEVLFNKNSKGIKKADIPNREVNNGYDISLSLNVVDDEYKIDVVRRGNIKVKLYKNGEDISSHTATNTYKTLEDVMGIDHKTFSQIVYQNTNASLQFLTATDTNRKRFLIDLLQLNNYVEYFEVFKDLARASGTEATRLQGKIDTINKWLLDNKMEDTSLLSKIDLPFVSEEDDKTLRSLMIEYENISEINKKINKNNFTKEQLSEIDVTAYKEQLEEYTTEFDVAPLSKNITLAKYKTNEHSESLKEYKTMKGECPTCHQDIDEEFVQKQIEYHSEKAAYYDKQIVELTEEKTEANRVNTIRIVAKRKVEEWEDLFRDIDNSLPGDILDAEQLKNDIIKLKKKIKDSRDAWEDVAAENERIERHNTRISIIEEQQQDFEDQLTSLTEEISKVEEKLGHIEILKKAFSTNGLLAYKIENLVKDLEELTNEYLAELSDGRFSLEFVVLNDKLNVEIDDNGKPVDILALSAGELARVNTSTLLAIRKLMSSISKSRINALFLDEVTNVLDELGKEKLVEILLREENLNTYIVSHGWTHPLLSKIEVIKEDKVSHLDG